MYFGKLSIILLIAFVTINAQRCSKKRTKSKIRKTAKLPTYGCQNPLIDLSCGCRGDSPLAPFAPVELTVTGPLIDVPNYRYVDAAELNPLGCLFPTFEVPNYSIVSSPTQLVEIVGPNCGCTQPCAKTCGCPAPQCGCGSRAPTVKLPVCQEQTPVYINSVIELPSYGPLVPYGCQANPCGCQAPCGCSEFQILPCGCKGPCGCTDLQILPCGCQGSCGCQNIQVSSCNCAGACDCGYIPISTCECVGPCGCSAVQTKSCGCSGPCGCPVQSCGCVGPCGCGCSSLQAPALILPAAEMPYTYTPACGCGAPVCGCGAPACGCGAPNCGCNTKYLRQVTLQPPFL